MVQLGRSCVSGTSLRVGDGARGGLPNGINDRLRGAVRSGVRAYRGLDVDCTAIPSFILADL